MHVANSDGAFVASTIISHGVPWANLVHPTYNMITKYPYLLGIWLDLRWVYEYPCLQRCRLSSNQHHKWHEKFLCIVIPRLEIQGVYQSTSRFPFPNSNHPCHMPLSKRFHQWTPTTLAILLKLSKFGAALQWRHSLRQPSAFVQTPPCLEKREHPVSFEVVSFVTRYLRKNVQILSTSGAPPGLA